MASLFRVAFFLFLGLMVRASQAQLCPTFYDESCPDVSNIVRRVVQQALVSDERAGARLIRLHFHDCFVNGCDGSVLLEDQPGVVSELAAPGNANITGFNIVNNIKAAVEKACPGVVSCADILAIASVESVNLAGGPCWEVQLGRRDSRRANLQGAIDGLPSPFENVTQLKRKFDRVDLDSTDLVALSGAHTFGKSRCQFFDRRLNVSNPDSTLNPRYAQQLRQACSSGRDTFVNLDPTTPNKFDKNYYTNLQSNTGLLTSDQVLHSTPGEDTVKIVNLFAASQNQFFESFGQSMINMGNIQPLTGNQGEIRSNCRRLN
ncbi:peroxidase 2 [Cucumis sativus]|uniref:Peroxidase n=1 Tax=Cucumis sativus TaxID=3659 RepID=A0A0A0KX49_CUCSA|nr:peroxidase 2 precursor [Cucumis sativus]KGN54098.1 hypothetical protein Csa_018006 [Cucumis sativus]